MVLTSPVYIIIFFGEYGLEGCKTCHDDGLQAVEENCEEKFSGTDVGIAFHNLNMMKILNIAGIGEK